MIAGTLGFFVLYLALQNRLDTYAAFITQSGAVNRAPVSSARGKSRAAVAVGSWAK